MVQLASIIIDLISSLLLIAMIVRLLLCEWAGLLLSNLVVPYYGSQVSPTVYMGLHGICTVKYLLSAHGRVA